MSRWLGTCRARGESLARCLFFSPVFLFSFFFFPSCALLIARFRAPLASFFFTLPSTNTKGPSPMCNLPLSRRLFARSLDTHKSQCSRFTRLLFFPPSFLFLSSSPHFLVSMQDLRPLEEQSHDELQPISTSRDVCLILAFFVVYYSRITVVCFVYLVQESPDVSPPVVSFIICSCAIAPVFDQEAHRSQVGCRNQVSPYLTPQD